MVPNRTAEHRIARLQSVQDSPLRGLTLDFKFHLEFRFRQRPQMRGQYYPNHGSVWTSTDSTAGRLCTIGFQVSPALADMYTCPPVVPKYTPHSSSESIAMASRSTL